jgi:hypothetical protein
MLSDRLPDPGNEEGTSMVELLVGMAMGMVVLAGLSMLLIVVMHGNARVDARVEASDNARLAMTRIMEELHSACAVQQLAPVQEKSTIQNLIFIHDPYGAASTPNQLPVMSQITYSPTKRTLSEADKKAEAVSGLGWKWPTAWEPPRILASSISPANSNQSIFNYYRYTAGALAEKTPLSAPVPGGLSEVNARATILVNVAFKASPRNEPVADSGAATTIQNSATFRLTPPSYYNLEEALPCE